jgi:dethiobiotin synthetase
LAAANDGALTVDEINPVRLDAPLSPLAAGRAAGVGVEPLTLTAAVGSWSARCEGPLLVEGVGGWLAPITREYWVRDWARELELPVVIVAPAGLGMLNHTLLTIESARAAGCELAGVIVNHFPADGADLAAATNPALVEELGQVSVFNFRAPEDLREMPGWMRF